MSRALNLFDAWKRLDLEDIVNLARTNKDFRYEVYDDDRTWVYLLRRDYGIEKKDIPDSYDARDYYVVASMDNFVERYKEEGNSLTKTVFKWKSKLSQEDKINDLGIASECYQNALVWAGYSSNSQYKLIKAIDRWIPSNLLEYYVRPYDVDYDPSLDDSNEGSTDPGYYIVLTPTPKWIADRKDSLFAEDHKIP